MSESTSARSSTHWAMPGLNASTWASNYEVVRVLVLSEIRLRSRRWSTLFALFLMLLLCWNMIVDPASGMAMLTINNRRTLYTSSALALGSACLLSVLLLFAGFYLLRGRVAEDIRTGIGNVIAASPVSNAVFLASRWLASVFYFMLLAYTGMLTVMVLQLVRGEPGLQWLIYLQTYSLVFLPLACYVASIAILFDSVPALMGKRGDLVFFILWVLQISLLAQVAKPEGNANLALFVFDFNGMMTVILNLQEFIHTTSFALGGSKFDPALTPVTLPASVWASKYLFLRFASALLATVPLAIAIGLFHRYSVDRVKAAQVRQRRSPIQMLNQLSQPLAHLAKPLLHWAGFLPPVFAGLVAELALSLIAAPVFILAMLVLNIAAAVVAIKALPVVLMLMILCWALASVDMASRDFQAGMLQMTAVTPGGSDRRFWRQHGSSLCLAFLFVFAALPRLFLHDGFGLLMLISGFVAATCLAHAAGSMTKSPRLFLAVFLFWFYIAIQAPQFAWLDLFGVNHVANRATLFMLVQLSVAAGLTGFMYQRLQQR